MRDNVTKQKKLDRHYEKIRSKAAELAELINSGNTYLHLVKMIGSMNDSPEEETQVEFDFYQPITENEIKFKNEFLPILKKMSNIELPKAGKKPINYYRKIFILKLYRYFWKEDSDPRGVPFVNFCNDAFVSANDNLEISTIEGIIKNIPLEHFKR